MRGAWPSAWRLLWRAAEGGERGGWHRAHDCPAGWHSLRRLQHGERVHRCGYPGPALRHRLRRPHSGYDLPCHHHVLLRVLHVHPCPGGAEHPHQELRGHGALAVPVRELRLLLLGRVHSCFHSFAAGVVYVISMGDCFSAIFGSAFDKNPNSTALKFLATKEGNRVVTSMVWLCVMVPLVVPKHVDSLRYASATAVTFMVYFVIVVVIHSCRHGLPENVHNVRLVGNQEHDVDLAVNAVFLFRTGNSVIHSVGVFMFSYICQINAYEIFWDFRPEIRTTKNYTWSALIGVLICGVLYILVCVFGYFDFGSKNLLGKSLLLMYHPLEEADVMIAYVGVMIKLCVAYALLILSARNSLYYLIGFQHRYRNRPDAAAALCAPSTPSFDNVTMERVEDADDMVQQPSVKAAVTDEVCEVRTMDGQHETTQEGVEKGQPGADNDGVPLTVDEVDKDFEDNTTEDTTYVDNIPFWKHLIVVLSLSAASLLCGLFIPNINTVFGFAGSISGACMAFVFPALFFMYSGNFSVAQVGWFTYLNTYILLLCGVVGIVFGTGGTIYDTI
ncbi:putative mitochondrial amino acid permease (AAT1.2) [Leptomonas pyrrhocoris]|uniref:Putative mitochondrial amino acid permease (AAT1.2) n=1 Tax=Leptomonas pyrrhocoris TaxID=157538 RepID=A0A0M9FZ07_LEPPY|nr:putative mitochondrial amino acid permease (AAT1.2) [Leptomonas pyrrhocoris]KPA78819.1 putative mitochondrial amino acid permease (AAT1.2) [Leptomonas pyrrhocoris]|eukprot:XP_015657258.1 putative mitochondrial amino acid permease (AAT1.2) [Leptomonas pyrrhocoris]